MERCTPGKKMPEKNDEKTTSYCAQCHSWSDHLFMKIRFTQTGCKRSPLSFICEFKAASAAGERACGLFSPIKQHSLGLFTACWYAADNSTSHDSPLAHHFLPEHASAGGDVLDLRFTLHRANANTSPLYGTLHLKC